MQNYQNQREQYYYSEHQPRVTHYMETMDRGSAISRRNLKLKPVESVPDAEMLPAPQGRASQYCTLAESGQLYINSEITAKERLQDYQTADVLYDHNYNVLAVRFRRDLGGEIPVVPRKNATMLYIKPVLNGIPLASQFMLGRRAILFYDRTRDSKTFVILFGMPK